MKFHIPRGVDFEPCSNREPFASDAWIAGLLELLDSPRGVASGLQLDRSNWMEAAWSRSARRLRIDFETRLRKTSNTRGCRPSAGSAEAMRELELVHRTEVGRLLRVAAEYNSPTAQRQAWFDFDCHANDQYWRVEAAIECLLAYSDGFVGEELELLGRCAMTEVEHWPGSQIPGGDNRGGHARDRLAWDRLDWDSRALVEASLTVWDCEEGRIALARNDLTMNAPQRALKVLSAALRRGVSPENKWRLYAGIGRAHELCGGDRLALGAYRVASSALDCGVGPQIDGLFMALAVGEVELALELGAQLKASRHSSSQQETTELALLQRLKARGVTLPWRPSEHRSNQLFRAWCDGDAGPSSSLCRRLARGSLSSIGNRIRERTLALFRERLPMSQDGHSYGHGRRGQGETNGENS